MKQFLYLCYKLQNTYRRLPQVNDSQENSPMGKTSREIVNTKVHANAIIADHLDRLLLNFEILKQALAQREILQHIVSLLFLPRSFSDFLGSLFELQDIFNSPFTGSTY